MNNLKADTRKFDLDLTKGELAENEFAQILQNKSVEVKSERGKWQKTGNIAIEYRCNGKPSGIAISEAEYWTQMLYNSSDECLCCLTFKTEVLRKLARHYYLNGHTCSGGDGGRATFVLIPLDDLMKIICCM